MPCIHPHGVCHPYILAQLTPTGTCCLSAVGSHCPLWGKSKVSGNQRHQEHPSVMIKEVVGTWIRPPTPPVGKAEGQAECCPVGGCPHGPEQGCSARSSLLTPFHCFSPLLPFMKLSPKLNPNLCFWGKGNYDSHQHPFMN